MRNSFNLSSIIVFGLLIRNMDMNKKPLLWKSKLNLLGILKYPCVLYASLKV